MAQLVRKRNKRLDICVKVIPTTLLAAVILMRKRNQSNTFHYVKS
jgi:hypothetical protein